MSIKKSELMEGMVLRNDRGEWYVSIVETDGTIWLENTRYDPKHPTPSIEIHRDTDLRGFRIV